MHAARVASKLRKTAPFTFPSAVAKQQQALAKQQASGASAAATPPPAVTPQGALAAAVTDSVTAAAAKEGLAVTLLPPPELRAYGLLHRAVAARARGCVRWLLGAAPEQQDAAPGSAGQQQLESARDALTAYVTSLPPNSISLANLRALYVTLIGPQPAPVFSLSPPAGKVTGRAVSGTASTTEAAATAAYYAAAGAAVTGAVTAGGMAVTAAQIVDALMGRLVGGVGLRTPEGYSPLHFAVLAVGVLYHSYRHVCAC